jgi:HEAT repeat protein
MSLIRLIRPIRGSFVGERMPSQRKSAALGILLTVIGATVQAQAPATPDVGEQVAQILGKMDRIGLPGVWDRALDLEKLGAPAAPEIAKRLEGARTATKLAAAKALLALESGGAERQAAIRALKDVLLGDGAREARTQAADLLAQLGKKEEVKPLTREVDGVKDPLVKIALLKALRLRGRDLKAGDALREFLGSDDLTLQAEAAIALAECGNTDTAKNILERLSREPTERGRRAQALLNEARALKHAEAVAGLEERDEIV